MTSKKVVVIPCSGIGKPIGTVSRETANEVKKLRPDIAETACLAALTSGDEDTIKKVNDNYVITLDGCAKHCAQKNIQAYGKEPDKNYMILKFAAQNPEKKPEGIVDIGKGGQELVRTISEKIVSDIDEIKQNEEK
ncbi:MAG: putative zinc-binding protein [Actinobacteria bacterium]|nr:putative zinc-binding protein [Actinomycetota bacterium]